MAEDEHTKRNNARGMLLKEQLKAKRATDKKASAKNLFDTILKTADKNAEPETEEERLAREEETRQKAEEEAELKKKEEAEQAERKARRDEEERKRKEQDAKKREEEELKRAADEKDRAAREQAQEELKAKHRAEETANKISALQERIKKAEEKAKEAQLRAKEAEEKYADKEKKIKDSETRAQEAEAKLESSQREAEDSQAEAKQRIEQEKKKLKETEDKATAAEKRQTDAAAKIKSVEGDIRDVQGKIASADTKFAELSRTLLDLSLKTGDADAKAATHAEKVKSMTAELAGIESRDADFGKTPHMKALEAQTKQLESERKEHQERKKKAEEKMKKAEEALAAAKAKTPEGTGGMRRTFKRTGGPLVLGSISFADVDTVREELTLCLGAGSTAGWIVVGYKDSKDDKNIVFQKSGMGGVEELAQHLRENEIQYAIVRVNVSVESEAGATGLRDVFIHWCGPMVKIMEKGRKKPHALDIKKVLQPTQSELYVTNKTHFTTSTVIERSSPLSKLKEIE